MAFYSDDLLRLFKCYVDTVTAFLSDFADDKVLQTSGKTFQSFLDDEKHFFYHQFEQKRTPCCKCPPPGCSIRRIRKMNKMMFDTFYESTGTVEPGHEVVHGGCLQQRCIHRYVARNITLDDLDTTIICFLLYTKAALNPTEEAHIGTILKYRNDICHIWSTPNSYTSINTSKIWQELDVAILGLIPKPARQKMMKTFLQTHRQYQIEKEDSKAIAEVLKKVEQMNKYIDGIDGLLGNHYEAEVTAEVIREQTEKIESCIKNQMQECYTALIAQISKFMEQRSEETGIKKDFHDGKARIAMEYNVHDANVFEPPEDSVSGDNTGIWYMKCPSNWDIEKIEESLTDKADLKEFKIKFKKNGSIWLITTVPETFSTDRTTFELQIQSFITKLIEVCHFDTSTPCDVKINLLILQNGKKLDVGLQGQNVNRSTQTDSDSKVSEKRQNVHVCMDQTSQTDDGKTNLRRYDQTTQTDADHDAKSDKGVQPFNYGYEDSVEPMLRKRISGEDIFVKQQSKRSSRIWRIYDSIMDLSDDQQLELITKLAYWKRVNREEFCERKRRLRTLLMLIVVLMEFLTIATILFNLPVA